MQYTVEMAEGESFAVEIDPQDSSMIHVDGKAYRLGLNQRSDGWLVAKFSGREHRIRLRSVAGEVVVDTWDGTTCGAKVELDQTKLIRASLSSRLGKTVTSQGGKLLAPIAGNIVSLLVQEGSQVTRSQPIVVIDAMKMQNAIGVPKDGTVQYHVAVGQTVRAGELLATIRASEKAI